MSSVPNQFALFAAQVAFVVILIGVAAFSVLVFWSLSSIIGVISRSFPPARRVAFGILLFALLFGILVSHTYILHVLARLLDVGLDAKCT